jgi:hypothetical protein
VVAPAITALCVLCAKACTCMKKEQIVILRTERKEAKVMCRCPSPGRTWFMTHIIKVLLTKINLTPYHGSDGYSQAFHRGGPGSIPAQSVWDLCCTKWHWDRFFPEYFVLPCQFHSTRAPLYGKTEKLIIFITGLHNEPQGCGASVASAAGPFIIKKFA